MCNHMSCPAPLSEGQLKFNVFQDGYPDRSILSLSHLFFLPCQQTQPGQSLVFHPIVQQYGISALELVVSVGPNLALATLVQFPSLESCALHPAMVKAECTTPLSGVVSSGG